MNALIRKSILLAAIALLPLCAFAELQPNEGKKGKWGYYDESGTEVIKAKYDMALPFAGQYAKVMKGNKWGLIDATGVEVVKPQYDELQEFFDGIALVQKAGKYGYMKDDLTFLIPCEYTSIGSFNADGLVWVEKGGKYGIYRLDGTPFIEPKFGGLGVFVPWEVSYDADSYKDKKYAYKSHKQHGGSHHLLRKQMVSFDLLSELPVNPVGYYCSKGSDSYHNGVYTKDGEEIIAPGKYYTAFYPTDGYALVRTKNSDNSNFINVATGEKLFKKDIANGWSFYDGVALVCEKINGNYKWSFVDKEGNKVTGVYYDEVFPRKNDVYVTYSGEKYGMCDATGREILPASYAFITSTNGDLFGASKDGNGYGFINNKGVFVIDPTFDFVNCFTKKSAAYVQKDKKWGLIDPQGNTLVPMEWDGGYLVNSDDPEFVWVYKGSGDNQKTQLYNIKEQRLQFPTAYRNVWNFGTHFPGVAVVNNGKGKYGVVNTNGEEVIPLVLEDLDAVKSAYAELDSRAKKEWRMFDTFRYVCKQASSIMTYPLGDTVKEEMWEY